MKKPSTVTSLLLFGSLWIVLPPTGATAQERIRDEALRQIGALLEEKASRSQTQRKISSSLLFEIKRARQDPTLAGLPELAPTDLLRTVANALNLAAERRTNRRSR